VDRYPEDLGLSPDLSRLPQQARDLIRHGNCGGYPSHSEATAAVCVAMLRAGYSLDEVWTVMTDPANGISREFFEEDGERAEAHLERILSGAREAANRKGSNE
jgi:hypothetical protein